MLHRRPADRAGHPLHVTFDVPLREGPVEMTASLKVVYSSYMAPGQFKIGTIFTGLDDGAALVLARFAGNR